MDSDTGIGPFEGDAFGQALRTCHLAGGTAGAAYEIVERDDGLIGVTDMAGYFAPPDGWPEVERRLLDEVTGRVLDVGCGGGRHATALHKAGFDVLGLDPSPGAVEVARRRGAPAVQGSVTQAASSLGLFDTVLLGGHNLGLLGGREQAQRVLEWLAGITTAGSRIVATGRDPYATDDPEHLTYHQRNRAHGRMPGQLRLRIRHGRLATGWFDYLLCSPEELTILLEPSPWRVATVWHTGSGDYTAVLERR
ncbi:class I SAM-dependent methyltransferase [Haloechinothrix sp. LS1_15]|uniref:class I SAM-dependent methyltransferase n=1 Tax=Haloechinothrix sp. LS1_15 TaxID=2652248 RepID=UPI00294487EC|nr:class I SAM-dependent methyltransferase [Haloechinothrix sp. LS1_15]MDV6012495.1 class I SAM-dependent methyltransferase [Haloechinothrix sp. LS1_15]